MSLHESHRVKLANVLATHFTAEELVYIRDTFDEFDIYEAANVALRKVTTHARSSE